MSSVMPLNVAAFSRRYFGTLLVNSSHCIRKLGASDSSSNIIFVSVKYFSNSRFDTLGDKAGSGPRNQYTHQTQSYFTGHHAAAKAKSIAIKSDSSPKTHTLANKICNTRLSNKKVNGSAGYYTGKISEQEPDFGILFDIDGVIVRGKNVLPFAPQAFKRLVCGNGQFRVPTVFVTNAGNTIRRKKAEQLSSWLGVEVDEDQVVMSHSPLKMFRDYHSKHVLVIGQGPVEYIARSLGFSKVTTMTQLRHAFPTLDAVDHKRRRAAPCAFEKYFPRIEAIVLFGEPIRWETSLQLIVDVLVTNGLPCINPESIPHPHLPILACNMDLQWMAEAPMPRFGHGAFLLCLEALFKKVTGSDLEYKGLIGKPSEITYRHGEHVLQGQAVKMGLKGRVKNIYLIGDNICTDIFGANLYNRYLHRTSLRPKSQSLVSEELEADYQHATARRVGAAAGGGGGEHSEDQHDTTPDPNRVDGSSDGLTQSRSIDHLLRGAGTCEIELSGAENCFSVLVETGVYSRGSKQMVSLDHSPRDFLPVQASYQEPTYTVANVLDAVDLIFNKHNYS